MTSLGFGEDAVPVCLEEIEPGEWNDKVHTPDVINGHGKLYERPGYKPFRGAAQLQGFHFRVERRCRLLAQMRGAVTLVIRPLLDKGRKWNAYSKSQMIQSTTQPKYPIIIRIAGRAQVL